MSHYFVCFHGESTAVAAGIRRQGRHQQDELDQWSVAPLMSVARLITRRLIDRNCFNRLSLRTYRKRCSSILTRISICVKPAPVNVIDFSVNNKDLICSFCYFSFFLFCSIRNLEVVRPACIELPRSLVEVVVRWNQPMHIWLKNYVFRRILPSGGRFLATLGTFAASALLHGLSFRLSAVLFSLGFYTYTEHTLRLKLATIFNACIGARPCHVLCDHRNTPQTCWWVNLINGLWTLLALLNLAYLGMMFDEDQPIDMAEEFNQMSTGNTMESTLKKWSQLKYSCHWISLVMFAFNCLL